MLQVEALRRAAYDFLVTLIPEASRDSVVTSLSAVVEITGAPARSSSRVVTVDIGGGAFGMSGFRIPLGGVALPTHVPYALTAPTTSRNLVSGCRACPQVCCRPCSVSPSRGCRQVRVLRAMQLPQPILLEGSPGVGKTSLINALALASGHRLVCVCGASRVQTRTAHHSRIVPARTGPNQLV
jgi:hypothetical protein